MGNDLLGKKEVPVKKVPTAIEVKTYIMVAKNKLTYIEIRKGMRLK